MDACKKIYESPHGQSASNIPPHLWQSAVWRPLEMAVMSVSVSLILAYGFLCSSFKCCFEPIYSLGIYKIMQQ